MRDGAGVGDSAGWWENQRNKPTRASQSLEQAGSVKLRRRVWWPCLRFGGLPRGFSTGSFGCGGASLLGCASVGFHAPQRPAGAAHRLSARGARLDKAVMNIDARHRGTNIERPTRRTPSRKKNAQSVVRWRFGARFRCMMQLCSALCNTAMKPTSRETAQAVRRPLAQWAPITASKMRLHHAH